MQHSRGIAQLPHSHDNAYANVSLPLTPVTAMS